jgi:hypothetical protein
MPTRRLTVLSIRRHCSASWAAFGATALLSILCLAPASVAAQTTQIGTWELHNYGSGAAAQVEITLETRQDSDDHDMTSFEVPLSALAGLTAQAIQGADGGVRFRLTRDAGTFSCEGRAGRGRGAGTFEFLPDPNFAIEIAKRGYERPTPAEQFDLALNNVNYDVIDELQTETYARPTIHALVEMGMHGVSLDFLRGLNELGYRVGTVDRLIELRDHGVTPDYIRELAGDGYAKLSARDLVTLRDHGVTPRYIADLARIGYKGLAADELLSARDHGVSASWTEGFQQAGYTQLSMRDLVELRDHGVTPAFATRLRREGGPLPSVRELISRRDRGNDD